MEYPELKKILNDRMLLEEEKKMWLRLGLYVTTETHPKWVDATHTWIKVVTIFDGMGNEADIGEIMGKNLRRSILAWWQVERVKPRAEEIDTTGLSQIEVERG